MEQTEKPTCPLCHAGYLFFFAFQKILYNSNETSFFYRLCWGTNTICCTYTAELWCFRDVLDIRGIRLDRTRKSSPPYVCLFFFFITNKRETTSILKVPCRSRGKLNVEKNQKNKEHVPAGSRCVYFSNLFFFFLIFLFFFPDFNRKIHRYYF